MIESIEVTELARDYHIRLNDESITLRLGQVIDRHEADAGVREPMVYVTYVGDRQAMLNLAVAHPGVDSSDLDNIDGRQFVGRGNSYPVETRWMASEWQIGIPDGGPRVVVRIGRDNERSYVSGSRYGASILEAWTGNRFGDELVVFDRIADAADKVASPSLNARAYLTLDEFLKDYELELPPPVRSYEILVERRHVDAANSKDSAASAFALAALESEIGGYIEMYNEDYPQKLVLVRPGVFKWYECSPALTDWIIRSDKNPISTFHGTGPIKLVLTNRPGDTIGDADYIRQ